jgi:two-component system, LuxR family, sensor kinase FixL
LHLAGRIQQAQDDLTRLYEEVRSYAAPINLDCTIRRTWPRSGDMRGPNSKRIGKGQGSIRRSRSIRIPLSCDDLPWGKSSEIFWKMQSCAVHAVNRRSARTHGSRFSAWRPCIRSTCLASPDRDKGTGIPKKNRERVFEPFFTTKTKGTGLGMAIARRIVEAHGGALALGPDRQPGTEFVLTLPRGA